MLYLDQNWLAVGAYVANLKKGLAGEGPKDRAGTKKDAEPNTAVQKAVECVAEDLDMYMQHDEVCQYGDLS